jgi:hypothetical protein
MRPEARLRRRRALLRRRLLQASTDWLLAGLVAVSVGLGALLWSGALWSASPVAQGEPVLTAGQQPYQAGSEDVQTTGMAATVAVPERLLLLYAGGGDLALGDAGEAHFLRVWLALRELLQGLQAAQLAAATPVGFKPLMQDLAAYTAAAPASAGPGVEADLGPLLRLSEWVQAATDQPVGWPAASDPPVDALLVLPDPGQPADCAQARAGLYLLAGGAARRVALPPEQYAPLCTVLSPLRLFVPGPGGYPVVPLAGAAGTAVPGVADPGGLLVPTGRGLEAWRQVGLQPEVLDARRLSLSVFTDPLTVRATRADAEGQVVFNDPHGWVLQVGTASGRATLVVPETSRPIGSWYGALRDALRFVDRTGGWPRASWLEGVQEDYGSCALSCTSLMSVTFSFSTRYGGLPILPPAGTSAAITVRMTGSGPTPLLYMRAVTLPVPGVAVPAGAGDGVGGQAAPLAAEAAAAIRQAVRDPPLELAGQALQVVRVLPVYVPVGGQLRPAWAVTLDQASGGSPTTVLVGRGSAAVLGVWRPR